MKKIIIYHDADLDRQIILDATKNERRPVGGHERQEGTMKRLRFAEMWWCGDEECDCTQPQINDRSQGRWYELGWKQLDQIAAGPFHSESTPEETREQWDWLLSKAREYSVTNLVEIEAEYGKRCVAYPTEPDYS